MKNKSVAIMLALSFAAAGVQAQSEQLPTVQEVQQRLRALPPQKRADMIRTLKQSYDQAFQQFCDKNSSTTIPAVMFMGQAGADEQTIKSKFQENINGQPPAVQAFMSDYLDFLFKTHADDQNELLHKSRDWCMNRIANKGGLKYFAGLVPAAAASQLQEALIIDRAIYEMAH